MHVETDRNAWDLRLQSALQIQPNTALHHWGEEPRRVYSCFTGRQVAEATLCPQEPRTCPGGTSVLAPTMPREDQVPSVLEMVSHIQRSPNAILNHRKTTFGVFPHSLRSYWADFLPVQHHRVGQG